NEGNGRQTVGEIRQAEGNRTEPEQGDNFPTFASNRRVDQSKFFVAVQPLRNKRPRQITREQEIKRRAGGRPKGDRGEPATDPEDESAGNRDGRERREAE